MTRAGPSYSRSPKFRLLSLNSVSHLSETFLCFSKQSFQPNETLDFEDGLKNEENTELLMKQAGRQRIRKVGGVLQFQEVEMKHTSRRGDLG